MYAIQIVIVMMMIKVLVKKRAMKIRIGNIAERSSSQGRGRNTQVLRSYN
jgi:hypothetical protein